MTTDLTQADIVYFSGAKIDFHEKARLLGVFGTPVNAVNGHVDLTIAVQPTAGDTMTIGKKLYTFVANGTADLDGEISVGTDKATAQTAIVAAINGSDGHNVAHPDVTAGTFAVDISIITAKIAGVAANSIVSISDFTSGSNSFNHDHVDGGIDGTIGIHGQPMVDATYLYICSADNTVADKNWRRIAIGSAF